MVDVSNKYFRYLMRLMTKHSFLYTEMLSQNAVLKGRDRLLSHSHNQHPSVCQLGGNDPKLMAEAAKIVAEEYDYDEVNINCGCPADRVLSGAFGAVLMKDAD